MPARHFLVLLATLLVLTGCATRKSVSDGTRIPPGHGVLVLSIETDIPSGQLQFKEFAATYTSKDAFNEYFAGPDGSLVFKKGATYWVRPIPAGKYMWSSVWVYPRTASFHTTNTFTIEPGVMTYVGHPVSYTHLDVYKRQVFNSAASPVSSFDGISFFALSTKDQNRSTISPARVSRSGDQVMAQSSVVLK